MRLAHEALLGQARADAAAVTAQASADAGAAVENARAEAARIVAAARADGAEEGRRAAAADEARARATARAEILAAQRALYDELQARARTAALALRTEPGYDALLARLSDAARRGLGPSAELDVDPAGAGGVRARDGSRRVDYTLTTLADRCLQELGPTARRLWE